MMSGAREIASLSSIIHRSDLIVALLRFHHDLDAIVLLVLENLIAIWRVVETYSMRDDKRWINRAALDEFKQRRHVLVHVRLSHLERQAPARRSQWPVIS